MLLCKFTQCTTVCAFPLMQGIYFEATIKTYRMSIESRGVNQLWPHEAALAKRKQSISK